MLVVLVAAAFLWLRDGGVVDPFVGTYAEHCSRCHGANLEGTPPLGTALVDASLSHGDSVADLAKSIAHGFEHAGAGGLQFYFL